MANTTRYNPFIAAGQAAIAELSSSDAQLFYFSQTLNVIDLIGEEAIVIGEFLQMTVGLFIFFAGESFESGQVFRQQIHDGYYSHVPETQAIIEGSSPLALLPEAIAVEEETTLFFPASHINFLPEAPPIQMVSQAEAWKTYVETVLGLKAWSKALEANLTCKQLRAELSDRGIQPAPKTRKPELVKILVEGSA